MPGITAIVSAISADVNAKRLANNLAPLVDGQIVVGRIRIDENSSPPRVVLIPKQATFAAREMPSRSNSGTRGLDPTNPGVQPQNPGAGLRSLLPTGLGSGYTTATVSFSAPDNTGGVAPTATAILRAGCVSGYALTSLGSGYVNAPTVTIAGDGTGATALAVLGPSAEKLLQMAQRSIWTELTLFECHCWDVGQVPDYDIDFDVAQLLYQQLIASAHLVAPGVVRPISGQWRDSLPGTTQVLSYGRYFVFGLEFRTPVLDQPLSYVPPATTLSFVPTLLLPNESAAPTLPAPTFTSVTPNSRFVFGVGQPVSIVGTGFQSGAMVLFGAQSASGIVVNSGASISCVAPASNQAGAVAVTILNPDNQGVTTNGAYTYLAQVATVATVTSANSPYTCLATDTLVEFDESSGLLATAQCEAVPLIGTRHTFAWTKWTGAAPPPVISGNGNQMTPFSQSTQTSGALVSSTTLTQQGGVATYEWDGAAWVLVG